MAFCCRALDSLDAVALTCAERPVAGRAPAASGEVHFAAQLTRRLPCQSTLRQVGRVVSPAGRQVVLPTCGEVVVPTGGQVILPNGGQVDSPCSGQVRVPGERCAHGILAVALAAPAGQARRLARHRRRRGGCGCPEGDFRPFVARPGGTRKGQSPTRTLRSSIWYASRWTVVLAVREGAGSCGWRRGERPCLITGSRFGKPRHCGTRSGSGSGPSRVPKERFSDDGPSADGGSQVRDRAVAGQEQDAPRPPPVGWLGTSGRIVL